MTLYAGNTILHEVELTVQNVGWLVGWSSFQVTENGSNAFSDFLHGDRDR